MEQIILLVVVFGIFWFLLIRPQQKRMRQHRQLISSLREGDTIITVGGIHGRVARLEDDALWLEVSAGNEIKLSKQAVSRNLTSETAPQATEGGSED